MLYITETDYNAILQYCKESLPYEACGLVAGTADGNRKFIKKIYLLTNTDASSHHFSIAPKEQFAVIKNIRACGYKLLGNFHSHPNSPAVPSREDIRLAYDANAYYMILSLMDINKPVLNVFNINKEKRVTAVKLVVEFCAHFSAERAVFY